MNLGSSLIHRPESYVVPLDLQQVFPEPRPLEVELGSGDGSFLLDYARSHANCNFLGVERLLGRLRKLDRKGQQAGLTNLRLLRIEAGYCLAYLLPPASVHAFHVYFPDPWPKRRHHRRRLVNDRFMELVCRVLVQGGRIYLRTDDADYFACMSIAARRIPALRPVDTPPELSAVITDFESDFMARQIPVHRAAYENTNSTASGVAAN
ncbi:MAG: tRNA (guanosine(46)-N7)-methyltransferase TrmB [Candidatus Omnitrophica bacterium]|nr:tRNA (guanosine(46)-N7)-methyltransferase TrmB [Candidatus Omnitrophota bacterium]